MTAFTAIDATGRVLYSGTADDPQACAAPGVTILEGEAAPPNTYRAGDAWVPIPARPSPHHAWDWTAKAWVDPRTAQQTLAEQWAAVRAERDRRLAACDWTLLRAMEQGQPVPTAWSAYRQDLRDITLQPDPFSIAWPEPPA